MKTLLGNVSLFSNANIDKSDIQWKHSYFFTSEYRMIIRFSILLALFFLIQYLFNKEDYNKKTLILSRKKCSEIGSKLIFFKEHYVLHILNMFIVKHWLLFFVSDVNSSLRIFSLACWEFQAFSCYEMLFFLKKGLIDTCWNCTKTQKV